MVVPVLGMYSASMAILVNLHHTGHRHSILPLLDATLSFGKHNRTLLGSGLPLILNPAQVILTPVCHRLTAL